MLGCLFHCLQKGIVYDELVAFPPRMEVMTWQARQSA
jgi:hypothetical protein